MAVLPWGHSRTRTDSNEPSRQAISDLIKQHSRGSSGGSVSLRSRSRATTPSSQKSQHRSEISMDSTSASVINKTPERSISSLSRPSTPSRPSTSSVDQPGSATRSLFQRGGLLRRKGSKISISLDAESMGGLTSPPRPASARAGLRSRENSSTSPKGDIPRPSISRPFDFSHLMHGDASVFSGLSRIDESDLALQFDAIQARYQTSAGLGDDQVNNMQDNTIPATEVQTPVDLPATTEKSPVLSPGSPPRPAPPPKDTENLPAVSRTDAFVRTSRSTENFSRLTPRTPTTPFTCTPLQPSFSQVQTLAPAVSSTETSGHPLAKPLPQLPTLVHAVSTQDDTARLLIAAPLPSPPSDSEPCGPRHHRRTSSRSSLRHMSTFPSSRNTQNGMLAHEHALLGIREEESLMRPHSDHELSRRFCHQNSMRQSSLRKKAVAADVWDEAIEAAWDVEVDADLELDCQSRSASYVLSSARESFLTIEQPAPELNSSPSTPLMTMAPSKPHHLTVAAESPNATGSAALFGLGIETAEHSEDLSQGPGPSICEVVPRDIQRGNVTSRMPRSAYSAVSNASSQESIILSIASSIIGTQRSSTSSISVLDYSHSKSERLSTPKTAPSPLLNVDSHQKAARPESGCLPPALLRQMNMELQKATQQCSTAALCEPKLKGPESTSLPPEMLVTFPVPESGPQQQSERDADQGEASDLVPAEIRSGRQRSNTASTRGRSTRASYSLFPVAATPVPALFSLDTDGITS